MYTGSTPQPRLIEFGATCTLALLRGSLLAVGNAGDSAAILGRCRTTAGCSFFMTAYMVPDLRSACWVAPWVLRSRGESARYCKHRLLMQQSLWAPKTQSAPSSRVCTCAVVLCSTGEKTHVVWVGMPTLDRQLCRPRV